MTPNHTIVVDLGFGDAGKGVTVNRLVNEAMQDNAAPTVVRYNGGCQAAHNVVLDDGTHHTFSQFGAGTLSDAKTFLSRFMMIEPLSMLNEAKHLQQLGVSDPFGLLTIDRQCLLTTPYHWLLNQAREEARGNARHGSCGRGIGETAAYALDRPAFAPRADDLAHLPFLLDKLRVLRAHVREQFPDLDLPLATDVIDKYRQIPLQLVDSSYLASAAEDGPLIFEGAQGVLLDEWYGFHPHTTWSTTTTANAEVLLQEMGIDNYTKLGVIRSYHSRHGAGPFPTEDASLNLPEMHNEPHLWMGSWRVGHFDLLLFNYALKATNGVDALAITYWPQRNDVMHCLAYDIDGATIPQIEPCNDKDLERQERLTELLFRARPLLAPRPGQQSSFYGVPIYSKSHGPRTPDYDLMGVELLTSC